MTRIQSAASMTAAAILALAGAACPALADTAVLTIDPAQSSIDVEATLIAVVGDRTDTASTSVSGTIEVELDDYGTPTAITIVDFIIVLDNDVTLNFDYGFVGSASATLTNAMAMYATPGLPTGPVPLAAGAFDFPAVPIILGGTADANYSFFLVGAGSETINLADQGAVDTPINGTVASDGETVTLSGSFAIDTTQIAVPDVADVRLVGTATLVASGAAPEPAGCNDADIAEPFAVLDLGDISTFINGFNNQDPIADFAPPAGVFDLQDLSAFVTAFLGGCP
jgi:hypothetical protein